MNQRLLTLSHGRLHWNPAFPPGYRGLGFPGSTPSSAQGTFGSLCIQEFLANEYSIRFNSFDLGEHFTALTTTNESGLHARVILKGSCQQQIQDQLAWSVRQNQ